MWVGKRAQYYTSTVQCDEPGLLGNQLELIEWVILHSISFQIIEHIILVSSHIFYPLHATIVLEAYWHIDACT